jgi:hypothetical protein
MKSLEWVLTLSVVGFINYQVEANDFKGFDDNNLFSLNWPGSETLLVRRFI